MKANYIVRFHGKQINARIYDRKEVDYMFLEQIDKNRKTAFEHLVECKKQNKETVVVNGNKYSYTTKRGLLKKYIGFNSFKEYKGSELYPNKAEQVNGFYFVEI